MNYISAPSPCSCSFWRNYKPRSKRMDSEFSSVVRCKLTIHSPSSPSFNRETLHRAELRLCLIHKMPSLLLDPHCRLILELRSAPCPLEIQQTQHKAKLLPSQPLLGDDFLKDFFDHTDKFSFKFRHIHPQADPQRHTMN